MSTLSIGEKHETKANYKKLIQDLRDQYPHDPLCTLIIETFANSLDAGANHLDITITEDTFRIRDDGKGMTEYEFCEYHNIASLTKTKGSGGIGFAGVGAKIYLDRAEYVITETRSKSFHGASKWYFVGEIPEWEIIAPKELTSQAGTFIEVKLNSQEKGKITEQFIVKTLQEHYNAVLHGLYGEKEVRVNGSKIEPWRPKTIQQECTLDLKIGGHKISGFFIKAKDKLPEEFQGISVIVFGKTVHRNEWFRQYAISSETITGMVLADHLILIVNTSKTQLNKTAMFWKKFHGKMSVEFSGWLEKIGEKLSPPKVSKDTSVMVKDLEKSINDVLMKTPELLELANSIFQNLAKKTAAIKSDSGQSTGVEVEGAQLVSGTLVGPEVGGGVGTAGPQEGKGVTESAVGDIQIEKVKRRMKSGIRIGFFEKSDEPNDGWLDTAAQMVTINTGHPAYRVASGLSIEAGTYHVWIYHVLRVVIKTLSKEAGATQPEAIENKILSEWYNQAIDDVSKGQINQWFPTTTSVD